MYLGNPLILNVLFHPRSAPMPNVKRPDVFDGTIPVEDDIHLGYTLHVRTPDSPLLLFFHGNGEIVTDWESSVPMFQAAGVSMMVVDYRGYGWSNGEPTASTLLTDTVAVTDALGDVLAKHDVDPTVHKLIMGRSLGSVAGIHAPHERPDVFAGVIIESGFAHVAHLLLRRGFPKAVVESIPDPFGNSTKIKDIPLPLLVIHGENDRLIPVSHGQTLYDYSPAEDKTILRVPGAGHNDIMMIGMERYFAAIRSFVEKVS